MVGVTVSQECHSGARNTTEERKNIPFKVNSVSVLVKGNGRLIGSFLGFFFPVLSFGGEKKEVVKNESDSLLF